MSVIRCKACSCHWVVCVKQKKIGKLLNLCYQCLCLKAVGCVRISSLRKLSKLKVAIWWTWERVTVAVPQDQIPCICTSQKLIEISACCFSDHVRDGLHKVQQSYIICRTTNFFFVKTDSFGALVLKCSPALQFFLQKLRSLCMTSFWAAEFSFINPCFPSYNKIRIWIILCFDVIVFSILVIRSTTLRGSSHINSSFFIVSPWDIRALLIFQFFSEKTTCI